jgi:universal stress protein E
MKKRQRASIMVAVRFLDGSSSPLLRKAAMLAKSRGCSLDLVHVISLPYAPAVKFRTNLKQATEELLADCKRRLLELAEGRELRGIRTTVTVTWDYPTADGLVRQVLQLRPQLLLAESHRHTRLARAFLSNTDWDLIRKCPCPLWLSKSDVIRPNGPVIAALDPLHAHAKPAALDVVILEHALACAGGRPARVLACHAYTLPAPPVADGVVEAYWVGMSEEEIKRHETKLHKALQRVADGYEIPAANQRVVAGDPMFALPRLVKKHGASVVVMGAVSRSALASLFIGHTAERVIDALDCDVLIVKPRGFKLNVRSRRPVDKPIVREQAVSRESAARR